MTVHSTLEINLGVVASNYKYIQKHIGRTVIGSVIKANAYGAGSIETFITLQAIGCRNFFVAYFGEIEELIPYRHSSTNIYCLNDFNFHNAKDFLKTNTVPVLHSYEQVLELTRIQKNVDRKIPCIIHIDTGINRTGLSTQEFLTLNLGSFEILYLMSHFASSDEPKSSMNQKQFETFNQAIQNYPHLKRSISNTCGIFLDEKYHMDMVRPGIGLLGLNRCSQFGIENCMTLKANVLQVRELEKGESIGYNATYHTAKRVKIATLSCGYFDGIPIGVSNKGFVMFGDYKAPIVGKVSMDVMTVDITDVPENLLNFGATIFGGPMSPELWAEWSEQPIYQHIMKVGSRVKRIYKNIEFLEKKQVMGNCE